MQDSISLGVCILPYVLLSSVCLSQMSLLLSPRGMDITQGLMKCCPVFNPAEVIGWFHRFLGGIANIYCQEYAKSYSTLSSFPRLSPWCLCQIVGPWQIPGHCLVRSKHSSSQACSKVESLLIS